MTTVTIPGGNGTSIVFTVLGDANSNYAMDFQRDVSGDTSPTYLNAGGESSVAGALNLYLGGAGSASFTLNFGNEYVYNGSFSPDTISITAGSDTIFSGAYSTVTDAGTVGDNLIVFTTGSNTFTGGSASGDTVAGGTGTDTINTGTGDTTVFSGIGHNLITLNDAGGTGDTAIMVGPSTVDAYGANDTVFASAADGSVVGGSGNLTFVAGPGADPFSITGGSGSISAFLYDGSNITYSDSGAGGATFIAGTGNETLNAAASSSTVNVFGNAGMTGFTVTGGSGSDYFGSGGGTELFTAGAGSTDFLELTTISGSMISIDSLSGASTYAVHVDGLSVSQEQAAANGGTEAGGNLTITFGNGSTVEFMGITASTLDSHFV